MRDREFIRQVMVIVKEVDRDAVTAEMAIGWIRTLLSKYERGGGR